MENLTQKILPVNKELLINIGEKTDKIEKIPGIKLNLYLHQQVLIKQIINLEKRGYWMYGESILYNKNIWLKSSIGTGKSLILLSHIQYHKNNNYAGISCKNVPFKQSLFTSIEQHDKFIKVEPIQNNNSLYSHLYHPNYYSFDIIKENGYNIGRIGEIINYQNFQKCSLIFLQHQVVDQFEQYCTEQTSLTFFSIKDTKSFFEYIINLPEVDILFWDTDKFNVENVFINISDNIEQLYKEPSEIQSTIEFLKKYYKMKQYCFNDFWVDHMARLKSPYVFCCFDDYDVMVLKSFYNIPSIFNIFIGSTMIQKHYCEANACTGFIQNKFINTIASFRVDDKQVQNILNLPPCSNENIICSTPSSCYAKFKNLVYVQTQFSLFQDIIKKLKIQDLIMKEEPSKLTNKDFIDILMGDVKLDDLYLTKIKPYNLILQQLTYSPELILDIIVNFKQLVIADTIRNTLEKDKATSQQINDIISQNVKLHTEIDATHIKEIMNATQQCKNFASKFLYSIKPYALSDSEIKSNKIEDPFIKQSGSEIFLSLQCYQTRCCAQLFGKEHINEVIRYTKGVHKCVFCAAEIQDIKRHIFDTNDQTYFQKQIQLTDIKEESLIQTVNTTKLQKLREIIKDSFQKNKRTMLFITNPLQSEELHINRNPQIDSYKNIEDLRSQIIEQTRLLKIHIYGDTLPNFKEGQLKTTQSFIKYLAQIHPEWTNDLVQIFKDLNFEDQIPDITIVSNLQKIIGANMVYIDTFIFYNVPRQTEELLQIIGRSRRIGRTLPITSFCLYYPQQTKTPLE